MSSKRFSEKQAAMILRRAMAMQAEQKEAKADGLDLPELISAGSEMGIDPGLIEAAVQEVEAGSKPMARIQSERIFVLDRPFHESDLQTVLPELRSTFSRTGKVTSIAGGIHEWQGGENDLDAIHFSFTPQGDRTVVRANSDHSGSVGLLAIVVALPVFGLVVTMLNVRELPFWMNLISATLIAVLGWISYRAFLKGMIVRREEAISKVFEGLAKASVEPVREVAQPLAIEDDKHSIRLQS